MIITPDRRVTYREWERMTDRARVVYDSLVAMFALIGFMATVLFVGALILA